MIFMLKEEKESKKNLYKSDGRTTIEKNKSVLDIDNEMNVNFCKSEIKGVIIEPVKNFDEEINLKD